MFRALLALAGSLLLASAAPPPTEPKPFSLTGVPGEAVTQRIEAEDGGVIEAVSPSGNVFRLTIPADALYHDATITLTPMSNASVDGAAQTLAVRMAPAGLQFFHPAVLTIEPATPFADEVWWLESLEGRSQALRPGLVAQGGQGLLIWHFSEGAAASGHGLGAAIEARGVSDAPGSSSWLEWQRNVIQQQFETGKIDRITYESKVSIIQERLEAQNQQKIRDTLERNAAQASTDLKKAAEIAKQGDLKDIDRIGELLSLSLRVGRQCQLLGMPDCDPSPEALKLMFEFRDRVRDRCEEAGYGSTNKTTIAMLELERMSQLLGGSSDDDASGSSLMACLLREWNGTTILNGNTEVKVKRLTCDVGMHGVYEYTSTGAVATNFQIDLTPPKEGETQYGIADATATVRTSGSCTVTCRQGIAASIVSNPRALIAFNPNDGPAQCNACPNSGQYGAGFLAPPRVELKPGPLCDPRTRD